PRVRRLPGDREPRGEPAPGEVPREAQPRGAQAPQVARLQVGAERRRLAADARRVLDRLPGAARSVPAQAARGGRRGCSMSSLSEQFAAETTTGGCDL